MKKTTAEIKDFAFAKGAISADHVICCNCGEEMYVEMGTDVCPICGEESLKWADKNEQTVDI